MFADTRSHSATQLSDTIATDATQPIPPRYWWLKRIAVASGVLLACLILLRVWWGYEAERRLQAAIKHYQDIGQPVLPSEFDAILDAVPDDQNAAILYEQAMSKIVANSTSGLHFTEFNDDKSKFETDRAAADELIQKNAEVFALVRKARDRPQVAWSSRLSGLMNPNALSLLSTQRSLAKLLHFSVGYHFENDNHANAIETAHDAVIFGDRIANHPTVIANLVGIACIAMATNPIEENGASLLVEGVTQHKASKAIPASRSQVHDLMNLMIETETVQSNMIQALSGERAYQIEAKDTIYTNTNAWSPTIPSWSPMDIHAELLEPAAWLNAVRSLHAMDYMVLATSESNWQKSKAMLDEEETESSILKTLVNPFGEVTGPLDRFIFLSFRLQAQRRLAGVALAIRLYEIDHGHRPETLQLLIPDYLANIPADPFDRDDAPIIYKLDGDSPVLYSVDSNGEDNGGIDFRSFDSWQEGEKNGDLVFFLDGRPEEKDATVNAPLTPETKPTATPPATPLKPSN